MAMVGEPWSQHQGRGVATGGVDYAHQGRARVIARDAGCVRLYAERDGGRLRGAEMLGPGVEHTAHLLAWSIQCGLGVAEAYAMPFYHPVLEEGIRTALREACEHLELVCRSRPGELEHGPAD
jgi:dihydrolipoamide dehydrogenase